MKTATDQRSCRRTDHVAVAAKAPGRWMPGPARNPLAVRSTAEQRARVASEVTELLDQAADDLVAGHPHSARRMADDAADLAAKSGLSVRMALACFGGAS